MMDSRPFVSAVLLVFSLATVFAQSAAPEPACETKNGTSCEECLTNIKCLWCIPTKSCLTFPPNTIIPPTNYCPFDNSRWGSCMINYPGLVLTLGLLAGILVIAVIVCLCCCCCKCENFGSKRFEPKMLKQGIKTKTKQEERKAEMKQRHDEIRRKYGLNGQNQYSKFA